VLSVIDSGDQLVLNVPLVNVACSQILHAWPQSDTSKCVQGRIEPTNSCIVDKQEPDCSVSYERDRKQNGFNLCLGVEPFLHISLWTQFVTAQSIPFPSLPLTVLPYLKPLNL